MAPQVELGKLRWLLVTSSNAFVASSDALVTSSFLLLGTLHSWFAAFLQFNPGRSESQRRSRIVLMLSGVVRKTCPVPGSLFPVRPRSLVFAPNGS